MKKVLLVLVLVIVIAVGVTVAFLATAFRAGSQHQEAFYRAVQSGDPKQVTDLFHPDLAKQVDEPVLAAWMDLVNTRRGQFVGVSKGDFHTSAKVHNGVKTLETRGTVKFTKGPAKSQLTSRDGKLTAFFVTWEGFPKNWFKGPADSTLYRNRGKAFLTHLLQARPDEAYAMMHSALQTAMPLEKLKAVVQRIATRAGALKSIEHDSEKLSPDAAGLRLKVFYKVACEKATTTALVEFQFLALQGHLIAFDLTGGASD